MPTFIITIEDSDVSHIKGALSGVKTERDDSNIHNNYNYYINDDCIFLIEDRYTLVKLFVTVLRFTFCVFIITLYL